MGSLGIKWVESLFIYIERDYSKLNHFIINQRCYQVSSTFRTYRTLFSISFTENFQTNHSFCLNCDNGDPSCVFFCTLLHFRLYLKLPSQFHSVTTIYLNYHLCLSTYSIVHIIPLTFIYSIYFTPYICVSTYHYFIDLFVSGLVCPDRLFECDLGLSLLCVFLQFAPHFVNGNTKPFEWHVLHPLHLSFGVRLLNPSDNVLRPVSLFLSRPSLPFLPYRHSVLSVSHRSWSTDWPLHWTPFVLISHNRLLSLPPRSLQTSFFPSTRITPLIIKLELYGNLV